MLLCFLRKVKRLGDFIFYIFLFKKQKQIIQKTLNHICAAPQSKPKAKCFLTLDPHSLRLAWKQLLADLWM